MASRTGQGLKGAKLDNLSSVCRRGRSVDLCDGFGTIRYPRRLSFVRGCQQDTSKYIGKRVAKAITHKGHATRNKQKVMSRYE